nr:hypothetical protein [Caballeronia sp. BR00000012568055]
MNPLRALEALGFFMADVQAGIGPFFGCFYRRKVGIPKQSAR